MKGLARKISIEDRALKMRMRNLYNSDTHALGAILNHLSIAIIGAVAHEFSQYDTLDYGILSRHHAFSHLRNVLEPIVTSAANDLEHLWTEKRKRYDLLTRIGMVYLDNKASPPWQRLTLNLQRMNSGDGRYHPKRGSFNYALTGMLDDILKQLKRGAMNGESSHEIIGRIRDMFNTKTLKGVREADQVQPDFQTSSDGLDLSGPVDITTGVFDESDIADLNAEFRRLNFQSNREYQSWFTDAVKKNNRYLRDLEQNMMSDALSLIQAGAGDTVPDLRGISDMQWVVERPGVCDICDKRANLTMTEIKRKMHDKYGGAPPPLHQWCRCELVPMMAKAWQSKDLSKQGVTWNPATGALSVPASVSEKYRSDLNFDQFMDFVSKGGGQ